MAGQGESVCAPVPPPIAKTVRATRPLPAGYQAARKRTADDLVVEVLAPGGLTKTVHFVPLRAAQTVSDAERRLLERLVAFRHPYFVSIERLEFRDDHLAVVTEPVDSALEVAVDVAALSRAAALAWLAEAAEVLDLLNQQYAYAHLQVRPDNLYISGGHVQLGLPLLDPSCRRPGPGSQAFAEVSDYLPPELQAGQIDPRSDQFSLAAIAARLLTGAAFSRPLRSAPSARPEGGSARLETLIASSPLADSDRCALRRGLAGNPHERFDSCRELVAALAPVIAASATAPLAAWEPRPVEDEPVAEPAARERSGRPRPETVRVDVEAAIPGLEKQTAAMTTTYVTTGTPEVHLQRLEELAGQCQAQIVSIAHNGAVLTFKARTGWLRRLCGKADLLLVRLRFFPHDHSPPGSLVEIAVSYHGQKIGRDAFGRYCEQVMQLLKRCFTEDDQAGQHVRSQARLRIRRTVLIQSDSAGAVPETVCIAVDVSSTGLGVISPVAIPAGAVTVRMPGDEGTTSARVVRCVPQDRSGYRLGLNFLAATKLPERLLDGLPKEG